VHWPKAGGRKPNAIRDTERTQELLVPGAIYVLVKRFTSKEEPRRVVACIYDPHRIRAGRVGFENHLNYFMLAVAGCRWTWPKPCSLSEFNTRGRLLPPVQRPYAGQCDRLAEHELPEARGTRIARSRNGSEFPGQAELDALVEKELF